MYASDYLETGFLNVLRGMTFTAPAKCYLALFLNDPGESGTIGTEIAYAGYARKAIDFSEPAAINGGIGIQNLCCSSQRCRHHYLYRRHGLSGWR